MLGEGIYEFFYSFGSLGMLFGLFLILVVDAMIFPALPELFAVLVFSWNPSLIWAVFILITACSAEVVGNSSLYYLVKKAKLPRFIKRTMEKYINLLVLQDEKIILMNRIAPVVPFVGAFIAACNWDYRRSILYIMIGGIVKYSFLLILVGIFNVMYDRRSAQLITLTAVVILIGVSFLLSFISRKRLKSVQRLKEVKE
jgi:membrane protein YqaA with SNARE-associated domain